MGFNSKLEAYPVACLYSILSHFGEDIDIFTSIAGRPKLTTLQKVKDKT